MAALTRIRRADSCPRLSARTTAVRSEHDRTISRSRRCEPVGGGASSSRHAGRRCESPADCVPAVAAEGRRHVAPHCDRACDHLSGIPGLRATGDLPHVPSRLRLHRRWDALRYPRSGCSGCNHHDVPRSEAVSRSISASTRSTRSFRCLLCPMAESSGGPPDGMPTMPVDRFARSSPERCRPGGCSSNRRSALVRRTTAGNDGWIDRGKG